MATTEQKTAKIAADADRNNRGGAAPGTVADSTVKGQEGNGGQGKAGRKPMCKADLGNGAFCELNKGHTGEHRTIVLTSDELSGGFLSDAEIASVVTVRSGVPDEKQLAVNAEVDKVFKEWLKRGGNP